MDENKPEISRDLLIKQCEDIRILGDSVSDYVLEYMKNRVQTKNVLALLWIANSALDAIWCILHFHMAFVDEDDEIKKSFLEMYKTHIESIHQVIGDQEK